MYFASHSLPSELHRKSRDALAEMARLQSGAYARVAAPAAA
jgi:hypothetical protein